MFIYQVNRPKIMRVTRRIAFDTSYKSALQVWLISRKSLVFFKFSIWQCCYFTELPWDDFACLQIKSIQKIWRKIDIEITPEIICKVHQVIQNLYDLAKKVKKLEVGERFPAIILNLNGVDNGWGCVLMAKIIR